MANYVYIATSLDGYIARKDGTIDWLQETPNPDNSDLGFADFLGKIDALVMGRHTFETVLSFDKWPYTKPVFVLSSTLKKVPEELKDNAFILSGDLKSILKQVAAKGFHNLYIDGGKTIQRFLKENLIDEMIITRLPVLLGGGIPLFAEIDNEIKFNHVKTVTLLQELTQSHYIRIQTDSG